MPCVILVGIGLMVAGLESPAVDVAAVAGGVMTGGVFGWVRYRRVLKAVANALTPF